MNQHHSNTQPDLTAFAAILPAPFGAMGVRIRHDALAGLDFLPPGTPCKTSNATLIAHIASELAAYYANAKHRIDLPFVPVGTPYRLRVWQALSQIPAGQTRSYGDIAHALASGPRAVGQAVGDNPLPIVIPCHRVIAADGGLGGFSHSRIGYTQDIKRWLLQHEHAL